ncbi:hypothetical protein DKM44_01415 [Deinococcus irradiatisoli]|uniref:Carbon monoxide dehydrogenase n=1 Tax=Deinococcus irradiatisoli TaxID=2202254 RepID=A0A2Z3JFD4_9DEIO|nr:carbon monoxide dehydrogenase subunit G [Deinococcus irradiatisoli]AWN22060.1 hypothetical protein DKM44_01415 [Deinococcus irradiatisoli]
MPVSQHLFQGSNVVAAPREQVWAMLQDPAVLSRVVPGLSQAERRPDGQMSAVLNVGVGPVKGRFNTLVRVLSAQPPEQLNLEVQGKTITGTAILRAEFTLTDLGASTRVDWTAAPSLSGLLAGVGGKLIESKARDAGAGQRYADRFFSRLSQEAPVRGA